MNIIEEEQLKMEIAHIFESGANEIRIFEMVKSFIDSREAASNTEIIGDVVESCEGCNIQHIDNHSDRMICVKCDKRF